MSMSLAQTYKGIDRNVFYFGGTFKVCSWECWLKLNLNQSVALMVLILNPDLLLLSALAVSYCLPLRTFSAPHRCHTQTRFQGWSQQQNSTTKVKRVQRKPHRSTTFCIHPAFGASSRGAAVGQQSGPLPLLSTSRSSQVSHLQQQQVWLSSSVRGSGTSSATVPAWKVVEVNGNASGQGERSLWRTPHENPASSASTHDQTPRWCQALLRW